MTDISDAQDKATVNAAADKAATGVGGVTTLGGARDVIVPTFVTATALQISASQDTYLYINIKTAAALAIAMGATSAASNVISISQSSALGVVTLFVPAGWYVKLTGTMANLQFLAIEA